MQFTHKIDGHTKHKKSHSHQNGKARPLPVAGSECTYIKKPNTDTGKFVTDPTRKPVEGKMYFGHGFSSEVSNFDEMESAGQKYIHSLIAEGEHQQLDFKFEISDARKIARTLSAFSNTDGGRLLIGVKDNGRISGVRSDEEFYMVESAASLYCKPEVRFDTRQHQVEGKSVLEIYIPEAGRKPVYARDQDNRWMAYIRIADENILANIIQLEVWKEEHKKHGRLLEFSRSEELLLQYMDQVHEVTLTNMQRDTGFRRKELVALLTKLVLFDVVEMQFNEGKTVFLLKDNPGIKD
jgi:predicted HTH transcriptional regulator